MINSDGLRKYLVEHGMMPGLKGFLYIIYAVEIYEPLRKTWDMDKEIADKFNTNEKSVERAIRYAISASNLRHDGFKRNIDIIAELNNKFTEEDKVKENKCRICGNDKYFYAKEKGTQMGLYCSDCNTWITWLSKGEVKELEAQKARLEKEKGEMVGKVEDLKTFSPSWKLVSTDNNGEPQQSSLITPNHVELSKIITDSVIEKCHKGISSSEKKPKVYLAGKITGCDNFEEVFDGYRKKLEAKGYVVLSPTILPYGMTQADYMELCISMLNVADMAFFIPGWEESEGARIEHLYCEKTGKIILREDEV